jgi:glycosyltransferase involved in cell wall biosynthesis
MSAHNSNRPIRVLFVDHTAQLGGGEIALRNLLNSLTIKRVHITVLLWAEGTLAKQLISAGHSVHILPLSSRIAEARKESVGWKSLLRVREMFSMFLFAWRLVRFIRRMHVDLVHTNSLKSHILGGLAARLAGRPLVWHLRDRIAPDYLPKTAVWIVRMACKILPQFVIANSQATLDAIAPRSEHNAGRYRKFKVIHDGCLQTATLEDPSIDDGPNVGIVGRISPWKGQHVFIKAAAIVSRECPGTHFQIIGAPLFSETEYEAELHRLAANLNLKQILTFTGFVSDVASAIARLRIVVHASIIAEPFGQVVIEGMAAGKPVIATRAGGIPEIMAHNETGLLVPVGDECALAEAMIALLRDPARARTMGEKGRETVREFFTIERHARAVEQVYEDVLFHTQKGRPQGTEESLESA